ncbi:MAG: molybdopterin-binding protein, partial [Nannocystaceae bacterium]
GSDITRGEVVLRAGAVLTARDTGVLAAIGVGAAAVVRRPKVGILSTGDEIVAPGQPLPPAHIHDCNQTVLADTCEELGCEALRLGIVGDCDRDLQAELTRALDQGCDLILLSGGTSKGVGDRSYRAVAALPGPAPDCASIVVHGVALKPGKPLCLAATRHRHRVVPIVVLPGFPSSALFTFHSFCGPLLEILGGRHRSAGGQIPATLAHNATSVRGRQQYMLVQLNRSAADHSATPSQPMAQVLAKGSGSISAFCRADGFITVPAQQERLEAGEEVTVTPLARNLAPADLVIIGSHCTGLEHLAERLHSEGIRVRLVAVGSQAGLRAARDGLCDIAPVHLYDPKTC